MNCRKILMHLVVTGIAFTTGSAHSQQDQNDLLTDLARPEKTAQAAATLIQHAEKQPSVREQLSYQLPHLLMTATDYDVVDSEARVAGKLKLVSTIPALIELLDKHRYSGFTGGKRAILGTMTSIYELQDLPVGRALADIGSPSIPALAIPLESAQVDIREKAARILILINTPESFALLQQHVDRETDSSLKRYIEGNLERDKELRQSK